MKWIVLLWVVAVALAVADASRAADPLLAPTTACPITSSTQMLCLHNYARKQTGALPLAKSPEVYAWASKKADRIIECGAFTHYPCNDPFTAPPGFPWFGENLAYGYPTIRATFAGWLASPGHRGNLLNPQFRLYGSAYRISFPRLWVTQFAK